MRARLELLYTYGMRVRMRTPGQDVALANAHALMRRDGAPQEFLTGIREREAPSADLIGLEINPAERPSGIFLARKMRITVCRGSLAATL